MFLKIVRFLLNILFCLICIVPISEVYVPYEEKAVWENEYLFNNLTLALLLIPLIGCWLMLQFSKNENITIPTKMILIALSMICFGLSLSWIILPIQDFIPSYGALILLIIFPLLLIYFYLNNKLIQN